MILCIPLLPFSVKLPSICSHVLFSKDGDGKVATCLRFYIKSSYSVVKSVV